MAATIEYLLALRRRQLGQDAGDVADLEQRARAENAAATKGTKARRPKPSETRLHLGSHARQRMAQRGLSVGDVYAIYLHGETEQDRPAHEVQPDRTRACAARRDPSEGVAAAHGYRDRGGGAGRRRARPRGDHGSARR